MEYSSNRVISRSRSFVAGAAGLRGRIRAAPEANRRHCVEPWQQAVVRLALLLQLRTHPRRCVALVRVGVIALDRHHPAVVPLLCAKRSSGQSLGCMLPRRVRVVRTPCQVRRVFMEQKCIVSAGRHRSP